MSHVNAVSREKEKKYTEKANEEEIKVFLESLQPA